jgi:hypothetical protein
MRNTLILMLLTVSLTVSAQTKRGGFFNRLDDPFVPSRDNLNQIYYDRTDTLLKQSADYNLKVTLAVVCEYAKAGNDTLQPYFHIYKEKAQALKELQDSGFVLFTHTVNHSTNMILCHIDSVSPELQTFIDNGYTAAQGIDTIVLNNTLLPITFNYFKRLPDDRYPFFGYERIKDTDNLPDSILYTRRIPPKSAYFSIYPNANGLKLIIREASRRFVASGLNPPSGFIHPGQEYEYTANPLDTLKENSGSITTKVGNDTVVYTINKMYSSQYQPVPLYDKLQIGNTRYSISYASTGTTVFNLKLTGYTGDGNTHGAILRPSHNCNWMWNIPADTMKSVGVSLGLDMAAVYPHGRQYKASGYNPSSTTKEKLKWAHQWGHIVFSDTYFAKHAIYDLCEAVAKHYIVGTNDHEFIEGGFSQVDSFYNFINAHRDNILICSFSDLQDSVYNKTLNPYENILPSFDLDLNRDNIQDGWTKVDQVWNKGTVNIQGDTTSVSMNSKWFTIDNLWGVEKGYNVFSIWLKSTLSDSLHVNILEYKDAPDTSRYDVLIGNTSYYIKNLTSNFANRFKKVLIGNDTDYITIRIKTHDGDAIEAVKPKMMKYTAGRQY